MNILLNSEPTGNGSVLFVIIGVAVAVLLYFGLWKLKELIYRKQISEMQSALPEEDD